MVPGGTVVYKAAKGQDVSAEDVAWTVADVIPATKIVKGAKVAVKGAEALEKGVKVAEKGAKAGKNFSKISTNLLKKSNIDAHKIKQEFVGKNQISRYDLYKDTKTGQILIIKKGGNGVPIPTGEYIK